MDQTHKEKSLFSGMKDSSPPMVSIVLPVHNGSKYLRESIESCLYQTFKHWELIIVNDCSTDESGQIAEEYAAKDSRVRVIHNETNLKLPGSLNVGFRQAKGEYLTWTSDDNRYLPHALQTMVDYLRDHPEHKMVCAAYKEMNSEGVLAKRVTLPLWSPLLRHCSVGACFLYHRTIWETVGEYDTNWFLVEAYEYWLRIASRYSLGIVNDVLYCYRTHPQSLTTSRQKEIRKKDSEVRLKYWKQLQHTLSWHNRKRTINQILTSLELINDIDGLRAIAEKDCFANALDQKIINRHLVQCKFRRSLLGSFVNHCLSVFSKKHRKEQ